MADSKQEAIFRKKTLERISSPEQLTDYLRVTTPGIWVILVAVILLLAGLLAWSAIGTLETTADAKVVVADHTAQVVTLGNEPVESGMTVRVGGQEYIVAQSGEDEYGRSFGITETDLPDGTYEGTVVVESVHPIRFLLESR